MLTTALEKKREKRFFSDGGWREGKREGENHCKSCKKEGQIISMRGGGGGKKCSHPIHRATLDQHFADGREKGGRRSHYLVAGFRRTVERKKEKKTNLSRRSFLGGS